jgi:hypothetical protein
MKPFTRTFHLFGETQNNYKFQDRESPASKMMFPPVIYLNKELFEEEKPNAVKITVKEVN